MKDTIWRMVMVGDFQECFSCGEPCGHVWFVKVEFDLHTEEPVNINTKWTEKGFMLCPENINQWTPQFGARKNVQYTVEAFARASQGPLYKLKDFEKGGAWEKNMLASKKKDNEFYESLGVTPRNLEAPEKILHPIKER